MITIYIITVDTRHGKDIILITTKPTDTDIDLIKNHYLKAYDLDDLHVEYHESMPVNEIPKSVTQYIAQQEK